MDSALTLPSRTGFFVLIFLFAAAWHAVAEDEVRHLLVAKFALQSLETAGLTDEQRKEFSLLSAALREEIDTLRNEAGIDKETISKRDEAHKQLKEMKLPEVEYWKRLQELAGLNDVQTEGFRTTQAKYTTFKEAAQALLTPMQQEQMKKAKKAAKSPD